MEKIYCKNCKWFKTSYSGGASRKCHVLTYKNPYFTEPKLDHRGDIIYKWKRKKEFLSMLKYFLKSEDKIKRYIQIFEVNNHQLFDCLFNEKFNCKYYERKWYKFFK